MECVCDVIELPNDVWNVVISSLPLIETMEDYRKRMVLRQVCKQWTASIPKFVMASTYVLNKIPLSELNRLAASGITSFDYRRDDNMSTFMGNMINLESLVMERMPDDSGRCLAKLSKLQALGIGSESCLGRKRLMKMTNLTTLHYDSRHMTTYYQHSCFNGDKQTPGILSVLTKLTTLSIHIGIDLDLCEKSLQTFHSLTKLSLYCCSPVGGLPEGLTNIRDLKLRWCKTVTNKSIECLTGLVSLSLRHVPLLTDECITKLPHFSLNLSIYSLGL